jgi:hypothetical protein
MERQVNGAGEKALEGYIAHQMPGRVRIKVPAAKGRPDVLAQIVQTAGSASDIKRLEYNPLTGSILIYYAPEAYKNVEALNSILADSRLHISARVPPANGKRRSSARGRAKRSGPSATAKAITSFFKSLDREIREATDNQIDLKVLLPLVAGILGLVAFRKKAATPLWLTLLIFAFHSFLTLHGVAAGEIVIEPPIE